MMVRLVKDGGEVEVKDFLVNLYKRNGYEEVVAIPKAEAKKENAPKPVRKTRKTQ